MRVLKVGGNELSDPGFVDLLAQSVSHIRAETAEPVIIVHGGGRAIAGMQAQLGLETVKVDGLRVTGVESLAVDRIESSFFEDSKLFPAGSVEFDCALLMRNIDHEWHGRPTLCAESVRT